MNTEQKVSALIEAGAEAAAEAVRGQFEHGAARLESPIERLLLAALVHPQLASEFDTISQVLVPASGLLAHASPPPIPGFFIWPQIAIGNYRVDFLIACTQFGQTSTIIVECDGHDFHEKTKEQAQRDKARDRFLASLGYRVLRYTGAEIYRDPEAVAFEIFSIAQGLT